MDIAHNTVITLTYQVTDPDGNLVDAGEEPIIYLHGGHDDIFPRIEEELQGKQSGDTILVKLQPDEAFGEYDAELVQIESRENFPAELQVGMQFEGAPEGTAEDDYVIYRVTEIMSDKVVLDGNHPLAGMALVFTGTVSNVRAATAEEIAHGHVHGDDDIDHGHDEILH